MVFLFTDGHVAQEGFLESINNMLTSGMVPALFPDDEKEVVIGQVPTAPSDHPLRVLILSFWLCLGP